MSNLITMEISLLLKKHLDTEKPRGQIRPHGFPVKFLVIVIAVTLFGIVLVSFQYIF